MPIFDTWTANTTLNEAIAQAVGAASSCWENLEGAGVFESDKAKDIVEELYRFVLIKTELTDRSRGLASGPLGIYPNDGRWNEKAQDGEVKVNPQEPRLGCATTEELFRELIDRLTVSLDDLTSRVRVERGLVLAEMLGGLSGSEKEYRTVDSY